MNTYLKTTLFSLFALAASQTSAHETTLLNFTLEACTQDNRLQLSLPVQLQLNTTSNSGSQLQTGFFIEHTQAYAEELSKHFDKFASKVRENTPPQAIKEIFDEFYGSDFQTLATQHRENINTALPDGYAISEMNVVTQPLRKSDCPEATEKYYLGS